MVSNLFFFFKDGTQYRQNLKYTFGKNETSIKNFKPKCTVVIMFSVSRPTSGTSCWKDDTLWELFNIIWTLRPYLASKKFTYHPANFIAQWLNFFNMSFTLLYTSFYLFWQFILNYQFILVIVRQEHFLHPPFQMNNISRMYFINFSQLYVNSLGNSLSLEMWSTALSWTHGKE